MLERTGRKKFRSFNWCETVVMRLSVQFNYEAGPGCSAMTSPIQCLAPEWSYANKNMMCNGGPDKKAYNECLSNMNLFAFICRYADTDKYFNYDNGGVLYEGTSYTTAMGDFIDWVFKSTGGGVESDFTVAEKVKQAADGYDILPFDGTPSKINSQAVLSEFVKNMCKVAVKHYEPPALNGPECNQPFATGIGPALGPEVGGAGFKTQRSRAQTKQALALNQISPRLCCCTEENITFGWRYEFPPFRRS